MTKEETALLAQIAMEIFSVDRRGAIWRHFRLSNGSALQARPLIPISPPERAEVKVTSGYLRVQFTDGEERHQVYAHRIVWMITSHQPIPPLLEVNHIDGDKSNNTPSNLEIVTKRDNALHALHQLGQLANRKYPGAKLTTEQVHEIRRLYDAKALAHVEIAKMYSVSAKTVSKIGLRKSYPLIPEFPG